MKPWARKDPKVPGFPWGILQFWLPFFLVYALAAVLAETPNRTLLKLGWAVFNIGGAILVCLNRNWREPLRKGFFYGIISLSLLVIVQALYLCWFGGAAIIDTNHASNPIIVPGNIPFLGYAQSFWKLGDLQLYRPNAFYYEPSYAGCALAFGFIVVLLIQKNGSGWKTLFFPALVLTAIILTSARSGILVVFVALLGVWAQSLYRKDGDTLKLVHRIIFTTVLMIALFCISSTGRQFLGILLGPLGPSEALRRLSDAGSTEGGRLANGLVGLRMWAKHPLLGNGVPSLSFVNSGLGLTCESMWVEIGIEAGLLGFLAFGYAVLRTIHRSYEMIKESEPRLKAIMTSLWLSHFAITLNLTATFPRLDYWLLFFASTGFLLYSIPSGASLSRKRQ